MDSFINGEAQKTSEELREIYCAKPMELAPFFAAEGSDAKKVTDTHKITEGSDGAIFLIHTINSDNHPFELIAKLPLKEESKLWNKREGTILHTIQKVHLHALPTPAVKLFANGQWVMERFSSTKGLYPLNQIQEYAVGTEPADRTMFDWARAMMKNAEDLSEIGIASTDNKVEHMFFYSDTEGRIGIRNIDFANVMYCDDFAQKCEGLTEPTNRQDIASRNLKNVQENILAVLSESGHVSDYFSANLRGNEKKTYDPVFDYINIICAHKYLKDNILSEGRQVSIPENILSLITDYEALSSQDWQDFYIKLMQKANISDITSQKRFSFLNDCRNDEVIYELFAEGRKLTNLYYDSII